MSQDFVKVANTNDIEPSQMKEVEVNGQNICLVNVEGKYYAIGSICTHEGGPLADGTLEGYEVECPWHNSKFDVRTGEVTSPPASEPEPAYEVKVEGNSILIKIQGKGKKSPPPPQIELTLLEKDRIEGTDVTSFKFSKQSDQVGEEGKTPLNYVAGQFAFFDIGGVYDDPKGPIRHFTISSSPTENFIMFSTRIRDSPYKKRLSTLEEGARVKVRGPEGQFVLHDEDYSKKSAVFLSGGIGVTPFRSMIKYATDKQLPLKITMFDSNRNRDSILFKKEFDDWANTNKNIKIVYTISEDQDPHEHPQQSSSPTANEWRGEYGRIDKAMILKYLDINTLNKSIFYICGPPGMLKAMQSLLQDNLEIPKERIKVEEFVGY
ncbi:MAG: Rieske 2Fe-2S domain-containing protein [Nitrososphaera sp.]